MALIGSKFIKDQQLQINKIIKKTHEYGKAFISYSLFHFALTEDIHENVVLLNINKSTVKSSKYPSVLT